LGSRRVGTVRISLHVGNPMWNYTHSTIRTWREGSI